MSAARAGVWPVEDLRVFLDGIWRVERAVRGPQSAALSALRGTAEFTPAGGGMRYTEYGRLSFGDSAVLAERRFHYDFPTPDRAAVRFRCGQPFHDLDLTTGRDSVVHLRAGDVYRGRYRVDDPRTWWVCWWITGPRKNFRTLTRYRRIA